MKLNFLPLMLPVFFLGCAHSGQVEVTKSTSPESQQVYVHIHDSTLKPGDSLSVFKETCSTDSFVAERVGGRVRKCEKEVLGCAVVVEQRKDDSFLANLKGGLQARSDLLFERTERSCIN